MVIIVAMKEEIEYFLKQKKFTKLENDYFDIYEYENVKVIISGIGLVNAASATTYAMNNFVVGNEEILNIGLAGSIEKNFEVLEAVFVGKYIFGLANATGFGYSLGQIPGEKKYFESSSNINERLKFRVANVSSADFFVNDYDFAKKTFADMPIKIDICDMESAAIALLCSRRRKIFSSIKVISDVLDKGVKNEKQFDEILAEGSIKIANILEEIL